MHNVEHEPANKRFLIQDNGDILCGDDLCNLESRAIHH